MWEYYTGSGSEIPTAHDVKFCGLQTIIFCKFLVNPQKIDPEKITPLEKTPNKCKFLSSFTPQKLTGISFMFSIDSIQQF